MRYTTTLGTLCVSFILSGGSLAADPQLVRESIARGSYLEAARLGEGSAEAASRALAAEALAFEAWCNASGNDSRQIALYERALSIVEDDDVDADSLIQRGRSRAKLLELEGGMFALFKIPAILDDFRTALELEPENPRAHLGLGATYAGMLQASPAAGLVASRDEAVESLCRAAENAQANEPTDAVIYYSVGSFLWSLGRDHTATATRILERALMDCGDHKPCICTQEFASDLRAELREYGRNEKNINASYDSCASGTTAEGPSSQRKTRKS